MPVEFGPVKYARESPEAGKNILMTLAGIASIVGIPLIVAGLSRRIDPTAFANKFLPKSHIADSPGEHNH